MRRTRRKPAGLESTDESKDETGSGKSCADRDNSKRCRGRKQNGGGMTLKRKKLPRRRTTIDCDHREESHWRKRRQRKKLKQKNTINKMKSRFCDQTKKWKKEINLVFFCILKKGWKRKSKKKSNFTVQHDNEEKIRCLQRKPPVAAFSYFRVKSDSENKKLMPSLGRRDVALISLSCEIHWRCDLKKRSFNDVFNVNWLQLVMIRMRSTIRHGSNKNDSIVNRKKNREREREAKRRMTRRLKRDERVMAINLSRLWIRGDWARQKESGYCRDSWCG